MSVRYSVTGESFDQSAWRKQVLEEVGDEESGWAPLPHTGRLTEHEDWLLLVDGSVRGVGISKGEKGEEIKIGSMASLRDWELGFRVLEMALENGAEVWDEEGAEMAAGDLGGGAATAACEESWEFGKSVLVSLARDGKKPTLPCGLFSLVLTGDELKLDDAQLMELLASQVRRYASAHPAGVMVLTSPDGEHEISAANYGQIATLIPEEATHITFGALGGDVIEGVVSVGEFQKVFGELVEPAGKYWFVPEVNFDEERVILKALKEKSMEADAALAVAPKPVIHPHRKPITDGQWEILESGPALVFLSVAASDGKVSKRETTTFAKVIVGASHLEAECPSLGRALGASLEKVPEVIAQIESADQFDAAAELRKIGKIVDKCLTEDEATNYKLGLLYIGREVAEASGGFFGMGRRINEREAAALKMIAEAFGIGLEE